jgi:hypothetical protein
MLIRHQPFRNVLFIVHLQQIAFHHVADGVQRQIVIFCAERVFQLFRQGVQRDKGVGDQRRDKGVM